MHLDSSRRGLRTILKGVGSTLPALLGSWMRAVADLRVFSQRGGETLAEAVVTWLRGTQGRQLGSTLGRLMPLTS